MATVRQVPDMPARFVSTRIGVKRSASGVVVGKGTGTSLTSSSCAFAVLGAGGHSHAVVEARDGETVVAVKLYERRECAAVDGGDGGTCTRSRPCAECAADAYVELYEREVATMLAVPPHANVVPLLDSFWSDSYMIVVVPRYRCDLRTYVREHRVGAFPAQRSIAFMRSLLEAAAFLHAHSVVHRDLTPRNVFLTHNWTPVIGDFSSAAIMHTTAAAEAQSLLLPPLPPPPLYSASSLGAPPPPPPPPHLPPGTLLTPAVTSMWFRSPETLLCLPYDEKVDVWSLALVWLFCLDGRYRLTPSTEQEAVEQIEHSIGPFPQRMIDQSQAPATLEFVSSTGRDTARGGGGGVRDGVRRSVFAAPRCLEAHGAGDLLRDMLRVDPAARLSATHALQRLNALSPARSAVVSS